MERINMLKTRVRNTRKVEMGYESELTNPSPPSISKPTKLEGKILYQKLVSNALGAEVKVRPIRPSRHCPMR
jgi:hypothetical protein